MISLPNGCKCSQLTVSPSNWKTAKSSVKTKWYVSYRFYDYSLKESGSKYSKQVIIKGMNEFQKLADRQIATQRLIEEELAMLQKGYNPIRNTMEILDTASELGPDSPFIFALEKGLLDCSLTKKTRKDIAGNLKFFSLSAKLLMKHNIPISAVRKRDLLQVLKNCKKAKEVLNNQLPPEKRKDKIIWNDNQFNVYRKNIGIIFKQLKKLEVVETNLMYDLEKEDTIKKIRPVLSDDDRKRVADFTREKLPNFHRFIHIFFHSGARITELFKIQGKDVDLRNQRFKVMVIKGKKKREVYKTIKDVALPFWEEIMAACAPEDYVFSENLQPGLFPVDPAQASRRWKNHIKKKLGINADLYSLKHLNTSETVDVLDEKAAAEMNSHTSTAMVVQIYDVKNASRKHEKLKKVANTFS